MKILTAKKTDVPAQPLFIEEVPAAGQPMNQITVHHINPKNPTHVRGFQITDKYLLVKRAGQPTVGIDIDSAVHLLSHAVPESSWPPFFTKQPQGAFINEGETAILSAETLNEHDHIETKYQWQQYYNAAKIFIDCKDQTSSMLQTKAGGIFRLAAINVAGTSFSQQVKVVVKPALATKPAETKTA